MPTADAKHGASPVTLHHTEALRTRVKVKSDLEAPLLVRFQLPRDDGEASETTISVASSKKKNKSLLC